MGVPRSLAPWVLLGVVLAVGCGDSATPAKDAAASESDGGSAGPGGGGVSSPDASTPIIKPTSTGSSADAVHNAVQTVSAGGVVKGRMYKMVLSVGEATATPGDTSSDKFRLSGGIKGAVGAKAP